MKRSSLLYVVFCMIAVSEIAGIYTFAASKSFTQPDISWTSMGESNMFMYEGIFAVASDSDGSIYLCGDEVIAGGLGLGGAIGKWDGLNWSTVAPGLPGIEINDLEFDRKGRLYAAGRFEITDGAVLKHIAMWDADKWNPVGNGRPNSVYDIEFDSFGNLFICEFISSGATILKMDTLGNWTELGDIHGTVGCFEMDSKNNLYVAGRFDQAGTVAVNNIARWNGEKWEDIGPLKLTTDSSAVFAYWIGCDKFGQLYAAGNFDLAGTANVSGLAQWDGKEWHSLGNNIDFPVYENQCAVGPDDNLYFAGNLNARDTGVKEYVSRWDGKIWHPLTGDFPSSPHLIMIDKQLTVYVSFYEEPYYPDTLQLHFRLLKNSGSGWSDACSGNGLNWAALSVAYDHKGNLYAGGDFNFAGTEKAGNIARWDGIRWNRLNSGLVCNVRALAVDSSDNLYAGGSYYGDVENTGVMKWNGNTWESISLKDGKNNKFRIKDVAVLEIDPKGLLYAGGSTDSGAGLQVWDGITWSDVGGGITGNAVNAVSFDKKGNLYAAGDFTKAGTVAAQSIARFDGSAWYPLGDGIQREPTRLSPVYALAFDSKGNLYAGGGFEYAGQVEARNIAKWDGSAWSAMNTKNAGYERNGDAIRQILVDNSDNLLVCGSFDSIGVTITGNIAVWNGAAWMKLDSNSQNDINGGIYGIAMKDNTLAIAGSFQKAGGKPSVNFTLCQLGGTAPVKKHSTTKNSPEMFFDKSINALRFSIPGITEVRVSVFTLSGRLINSTSQTLLPGDHFLRTDTGSMPPGTYIVQVKVQGKSMQYMMHLKR